MIQADAEILSVRRDGAYYHLSFAAPGIADGFRPGHFVAIAVDDAHILRRAFSIRSASTKAGGALGETGSVSFMWDRAGEIYYPAKAGDADEVMEAVIEAGADDVQSDEEGHTILCGFETVNDVSKALEGVLGEAESVKIIWKPQNNIPVDEERAQSLMKLVGVLEDDDDVQNVYANFEVDEATMAKLSAA